MRIFAILLITMMLYSCDSKVNRPDPVLSQEQINQQSQLQSQPAISAASSGVQHYYCANNCAGSGGDNAGSCPVCGADYIHNQAWHDMNSDPNNAVTTQANPLPEPAQNAAGVWHYTCASGCSGGAGSAIACSQCGSTLAHNSAYHN